MTRYRKKPVEVEAWQVGSDEPKPEWAAESGAKPTIWHGKNPYYVLEDGMTVVLSACVFEQAYEVVE